MNIARAAGGSLTVASTAALAGGEPTMPVVSTLVSLFVVLAVIGAVAFLAKRIGAGGAREARLMRVVSQLPLGAREKISIVELDDQWLVLGVTAQQITLLTQTAKRDIGTPAQHVINFSSFLNLARGKHDAA
jgi:flagellar protein FliO/FliZ